MKTGSLRAEHELLILAVQAPFDPVKLDRVEELLRTAFDWTFLVETANEHAVTPLLCRTLEMVAASVVPDDVLTASRAHLEANRARTLHLTIELLRVLTGLSDVGITAIPFKGPVLAERYFGDVGLRSFRDLDFLVPEDRAAQTVSALRSLGYEGIGEVGSRKPSYELSPRQMAALWRYSGEYIFFHSEMGIAIEPHWAFSPNTLAIDIDYFSIISRSQKSMLAGQPVLELSTLDTLLSLVIHEAKSNRKSLKCFVDLDRVIKSGSFLDWSLLLEEASRAGVRRMLLVDLQLLVELFEAKLDASVERAITTDPLVSVLVEEKYKALFGSQAAEDPSRYVSLGWLRVRERLRDRIRYVYRVATTPRFQHFQMLPLPDRLFAAYYMIKLAHDYIALPVWQFAKRLRIGSQQCRPYA